MDSDPTSAQAARDFAAHRQRLKRLPPPPGCPIDTPKVFYAARAPGRLDVMGGIGDYSGCLVLEMPIAEAAVVSAGASESPGVLVCSLSRDADEPPRHVVLSSQRWQQLARADDATARQWLAEDAESSWAAYVLGPVLVLLRKTGAMLQSGMQIVVDSQVPEGKGVSSSAAVEVATTRAVAALLELELSGQQIARLCQVAENRIVGAPCGIMDQMTSALGRENQLLSLLCQPAEVQGFVPLPAGVAVWGIDSGIRHAVTGADYTSVRTGAFMGYRILADLAGLAATASDAAEGTVTIEDARWHGYVANVDADQFARHYAERVPRHITGRQFLDRFGGITDTVTRVDPRQTYAVRAPLWHPIGEQARVRRFGQLLQGTVDQRALVEMGELMLATHASYTACGLGSAGTDRLVEMVCQRGAQRGLFGAKITGGGSGGTVAVLGRADAAPLVDEIAGQYEAQTGRPSYVFGGSSPGACDTPVEIIPVAAVDR